MGIDGSINISDMLAESKVGRYEDWTQVDTFSLGVASSGGHRARTNEKAIPYQEREIERRSAAMNSRGNYSGSSPAAAVSAAAAGLLPE